MGLDAWLVLGVIVVAVILFVTEFFSIDVVALLILSSLVLLGIINPEEGVAGFANPATITVAFMFVLSAALLKTGALQLMTPRLAQLFKSNYLLGIVSLVLFVGFTSAFVNNTPVVAVFIPVAAQIAHISNISPSKLLIPISFASIFGGVCSLIGTSTNIVVSGVAMKNGLPELGMFEMSPLGIIFLVVGTAYMAFIGIKLLPDRSVAEGFKSNVSFRDFLTEIELKENGAFSGQRIMDSPIARELEMDILEVRRNGQKYPLPPGDMMLLAGDVLKVRCNVEKIKGLKDLVKIQSGSAVSIGEDSLKNHGMTLVELVITSQSTFEGKTLREIDFRRSYRAVPLAIRHREEVLHEHLHEVPLKAGDVILAEIKTHHLTELKKHETHHESPFLILSEEGVMDFKKKQFLLVLGVIASIVALAAFDIVNIMIGAIAGTTLLVISKSISMKEVYLAIEWKVIFLLAGALSLGVAMQKSGLAAVIASSLIDSLGDFGPIAIVSGLYLVTALLTEMMSNNATAALLAPIAIVTAQSLGLSPTPFLMAVTFAASASFMTPVGYQTNTMVYSAGGYKFTDYFKVGWPLSLLFWIIASVLIPIIFPF
jgi:di/tricarboxylate transporter